MNRGAFKFINFLNYIFFGADSSFCIWNTAHRMGFQLVVIQIIINSIIVY